MPDLIAGAGAMLLFVAVTAAVALRSMRAGLATLFPNLLPVVVVFGFASLVGIELGVATMAVASVAIGLAVDDTLHLLFAAARARRAGRTRRGSLWRAQRSVGRAVVMSTAVLVGGLCCLALSVFVPTAEFGLYAAASSLIALVGDLLLLLPAVVLRLRAL